MRVVVAGGSGFIGSELVRRLVARGDEVAVLTRDASRVHAGRAVLWDSSSQGPWASEVASSDAVINLAGANIGEGRWTARRKDVLVKSRLEATGALVEALGNAPRGSRTLVNASAVGFYGTTGDEELDESSGQGAGFLADLVSRWEAAAREAESVSRVVILRFGVVLEPSGGALGKMLVPFRLGAGGPIGNGGQWMSWITRDDVVRLIEWSLDRADVRGAYNATAPHPVRNREFAGALGDALGRPALLPVPAPVLRLMFGQMADEVLIGGQRVLPRRALSEGYEFASKDLGSALQRLFGDR